ncbi:TPA: hypothetical protein ACGGKZ_005657 [Bacillus thuringiensis]|uniref:hypothetical protein n=1 Tax=Bacillus thuringiensis TaxID=1428 RepID=UPI001F507A7F|nr:hypothetical protein [Bacillus thuringiensis]
MDNTGPTIGTLNKSKIIFVISITVVIESCTVLSTIEPLPHVSTIRGSFVIVFGNMELEKRFDMGVLLGSPIKSIYPL